MAESVQEVIQVSCEQATNVTYLQIYQGRYVLGGSVLIY